MQIPTGFLPPQRVSFRHSLPLHPEWRFGKSFDQCEGSCLVFLWLLFMWHWLVSQIIPSNLWFWSKSFALWVSARKILYSLSVLLISVNIHAFFRAVCDMQEICVLLLYLKWVRLAGLETSYHREADPRRYPGAARRSKPSRSRSDWSLSAFYSGTRFPTYYLLSTERFEVL